MANRFEWDKAKAAANLRKHGVSFDTATLAFDDPNAIEYIDNRQPYGEERIVALGSATGQIFAVAHTVRGDNIRIISAWKATKNEQIRYFRQHWA